MTRRPKAAPGDSAEAGGGRRDAGLDAQVVLERMNLPVMVWDRVGPPAEAGGGDRGEDRGGDEDPTGDGAPPRFVLRWANAEFGRMTGRDPARVAGREACEVCPRNQLPFREVLDEVLATGESARFERWCEERERTCQGHVFRTGDEQVSVVMGDVTQQSRLLTQAAGAERRARERLDDLPVLVYELDADGNALYWNRETARALDLPLAPDAPRPLDQVLDPKSLDMGRAAIAQALEGDEVMPELVYELWSRSGRRVTIRATGRRLLHEGRAPTLLVVAQDITREHDERRAHEALVRGWEPEARSRLRHDLNNLLGRIMAAASLVEMEEVLSPAGSRHLEMVLTACEEAAEFIARDRADDKGTG